MTGYRLGVDIGGTFTDIVLLDADGALHNKKILSTPADYSLAIEEGVRGLLAEPLAGVIQRESEVVARLANRSRAVPHACARAPRALGRRPSEASEGHGFRSLAARRELEQVTLLGEGGARRRLGGECGSG